MKYLDIDYSCFPIGSIERFVAASWQLRMMRFHAFVSDFDSGVIELYDRFNKSIGVNVFRIDLLDSSFNFEFLDSLLKQDTPSWVWFVNCHSLYDDNYSGTLRSVLTTNEFDNLRVVFILDSKEDFTQIFQNHCSPFYKSTTPLHLMIDDSEQLTLHSFVIS